MKLFTKTFGCQMNFADSDEMGRALRARGFFATDDQDSADAVLVNTCTVRELAEHKAMSYIGRLEDWKAGQKNRLVIVTGCAAERTKATVQKRFPHVDLVVGAIDIEKFPARLDDLLSLRPPLDNESLTADQQLVPPPLAAGTPVIQYVTIMRGCNYSCTYCIVPSVRGPEVYRPADDIVRDIAERVAEGAKEIWLLGQTVNSYRPSNRVGYDFADLLRDAAAVPGLERLRFTSPHPHYLTDKLVAAIAEVPQVCEHLHLPVQSGSNSMLRRMRRNYTRESYLTGLEKLRQAVPGIAITTDLIAGFPGETDDDHKATLTLIKEAGFSSAYCFKYSPRPGTVAAGLPDDVPQAVKEARVNELLDVSDAQGRAQALALVGTTQEVLVEEDKGEAGWRGKTRGAWQIRLPREGVSLGSTIKAVVESAYSRELRGKLLLTPSGMLND
jgi:tRNA-2-methylthio-N6-dimethylallyladenosine synthase